MHCAHSDDALVAALLCLLLVQASGSCSRIHMSRELTLNTWSLGHCRLPQTLGSRTATMHSAHASSQPKVQQHQAS